MNFKCLPYFQSFRSAPLFRKESMLFIVNGNNQKNLFVQFDLQNNFTKKNVDITKKSRFLLLTCNKQETNCNGCFCDAHFGRNISGTFLIRSQRFNVHFLCLCSQLFLMAENMLDNLTVVVNDQWHWNAIGECEENGDKKLCVECIRQIVECTRC